MPIDDQTRSLLAILEVGQAEIREGKYRDVDEFLAELEQEDGYIARASEIGNGAGDGG